MSGYAWAKTTAGELFVVLIVDGKGYVPGVENAIDLEQIEALEPVKWPTAITQRSPNSPPMKPGVLVPDVMLGSNIVPFAESA